VNGMRVVASAAILLMVPGCAATLTEYRSEPATFSYVTKAAPDEVLRCLAAGYERMGDAPVLTASSVGQTLTWRGSTRMFVDIVPTSAGTRVDYHQHGVFDAGSRYIAPVRACQ